jgi:GNAT superfamily N-acetyltransferase
MNMFGFLDDGLGDPQCGGPQFCARFRRIFQHVENSEAISCRESRSGAAEEIVSVPEWREEPVGKAHDRDAFDCGEAALNEFLRRHARRSHDLGGAKTFLAIDDADDKTILGFYSLSPASIEYARTPEIVRRGLARYDVPLFRLARLAADRRVQGQGIGGQLLLVAGRRCSLAAAEVGGVAIPIDAKSERVTRWYAGYGAVQLADVPFTLLLPLVTIEAALKAPGKLT